MANNLVIWAQDGILPGNTGHKPLMNSGFTTLVLASFHIHPDGSIFWNGNAMVDPSGHLQPTAFTLQSIVSDLFRNGGFTNCLLSIGGGGEITNHQHNIYPDHSVSDEDFMAFYAAAFARPYGEGTTNVGSLILHNFGVLVDAVGATGIDVDAEPMFFSYPDLGSAVALLSEWANSRSLKLTWTPYTAQPFWQSLFSSTQQPLSWANIQPPAWGWYNDPSALASWAQSFQLPVASIVAGFANDEQPISPRDIQSYLAACIKQNVKIAGAYLWTYDDLYSPPTWSPADIASAMTRGLNGITPEHQS
jgi:hypothetical protein